MLVRTVSRTANSSKCLPHKALSASSVGTASAGRFASGRSALGRRTAVGHQHGPMCAAGATLVASGDGRYFSKPAIQTIIRMAAANGVRALWVRDNVGVHLDWTPQ